MYLAGFGIYFQIAKLKWSPKFLSIQYTALTAVQYLEIEQWDNELMYICIHLSPLPWTADSVQVP